jgi:hypothetical protein
MTFSEELIKVLEYLGGKIGIAIDWTSANMLPYLQALCEKIVAYEIWTSCAWIVFMWCVSAVLWVPTAICWVRASRKEWDWSDSGFPEFATGALIILAIIWAVATVIATGVQTFDIIAATYFPEKTIYEFITKAIQSAKGGY